MKLKHTLLLACLSAAPISAQQPAPSNDPKAEKPQPHGNREPELKSVPYIGVLTRGVPPEVRSQLSLQEGFGLMVEEVMPDSPGKSAGLKIHDILVKFGDQQLVNMEQLMTLVRSKKSGESVGLTVITGGKETQINITLGERKVAATEHHGQPQPSGWTQMHGFGFPNMGQGGNVQEQAENLQRQMREYQERLQDWGRGGRGGDMPQMNPQRREGGPKGREAEPPRHDSIIGPRDNPVNIETRVEAHSAANIIRRDESGEYQLKNEDGKKTFIVRPKDGDEKSYPVNNDLERQAVPEALREKLKMFDGVQSNIRIERFDGAPPPPANVPREGGPKKRDASA